MQAGSDALGRGDIAKTIGFALALAVLGLSQLARAVPNDRAAERVPRDARSDPLLVAFSDCESEPLGKQAFLKVLTLELGRRQLRDGAPEDAPISVTYRCDGTAHVHVELVSPEVDRELRVDDVAVRERARALALAVAELVRGGEATAPKSPESDEGETDPSSNAPSKPAPEAARPKPKPSPERVVKKPEPNASRSRGSEKTRDDGAASARQGNGGGPSSLSVLLAANVRLNLDVTTYCYGGTVALDYEAFRIALEGCGGYTSVARGSITTGIGAVRLGRAQPLARLGLVQLGLHLSAAGGVNWAVGNSSVVNTHVRRALMPYGDARLGLFAAAHAHTAFTPLVELYAGRAVGIVSNADGDAVAAVGGWFGGLELGLWL